MVKPVSRFGASLILVLLSGCSLPMISPISKPESPASWRFSPPAAEQAADLPWWDEFQDPVLTSLLREALNNGLDLRIAAARVEQAEAVLMQTRAASAPQLGYGGSATREAPGRNASGKRPWQSAYQLATNIRWEADLSGRLGLADQAARTRLLASVEGRQATLLSLVANVAGTYIRLLDLDQQLAVARATSEAQAKSLHIFQLQHRAGVISGLQLSQAQSQYEQARAAVPDIERAIAQTENALSLLLGRPPGPIPRGSTLSAMKTPPLPAGLPSELLTRRPDLRQIEHELMAARADLAAARRLYLPSISLTGTLGLLSTAASDLLSGKARLLSLAGSLSGPIFSGGSIEGQMAQADAIHKELLGRYELAVLNAFADVNDALTETEKVREQYQARLRQVDALRRYARLARASYEAGNSPYLEVLNAEQTLFNSELLLSQSEAASLLAVINTYAAMGGGWVAKADQLISKNTP